MYIAFLLLEIRVYSGRGTTQGTENMVAGCVNAAYWFIHFFSIVLKRNSDLCYTVADRLLILIGDMTRIFLNDNN